MGHVMALVLLILFSANLWAEQIDPYPRSVMVQSSNDEETRVHRIVTGEVKRVNGNVQPESAEFVRGDKSTITYEILDTPRPETITKYYRDELVARGQILFECFGRRCGDSNYWANTVFEQSRLYGPIDDQRYMLASIDGTDGGYVLVYLARRATGKHYAHIEWITDEGGERLVDRRLIASALSLQKRFVIDDPMDQKLVVALRDVINDSLNLELAIVAHNSVEADETVESARKRAQVRADTFMNKLGELGADLRNVTAYGAGPISPVSRVTKQRIELVLIR